MQTHLQSENFSLRQQLEALLHEARLNEDKMRRFDQLERQLISTQSLGALIHLLIEDYRQAFGIEQVTLTLVDPEYEAARIVESDDNLPNPIPGLLFIQSPALLESRYAHQRSPILARFDPQAHGDLFNATPGKVASIALIPLCRNGELIGGLHLGSSNPERYSHDAGTAFLERLANIIGICLESALTRERLKLVGLTDGLTGVQNRRYFEHRCRIEVTQARRYKHPLACMFLDIDKFKNINDHYGHQAGDEVLRSVARLVQGQLRASDTIARYGGEEFVVLLPQTIAHHAGEIAERIRLAIARNHFHTQAGLSVPVTISIGLSLLGNETQNREIESQAQDMVDRADKALYWAKNNGRNQVASDSTLQRAKPHAARNFLHRLLAKYPMASQANHRIKRLLRA